MTANQIEAARRAMTRYIKRGGNIWIKVFPDKPVSKKPAEVRMGSGKGAPEYWVAVIKPGKVLFEMSGVSEEVAREMLEGLKTDIGISTTGIAGPGGGTKDKPVGLVYIGIKVKDEVKIFRRELKGDRNKIRQRAMMHALYNLLKILK